MKPRITRNTRMGTEIVQSLIAQLAGSPIVAAVPRQFSVKGTTR